MDNRENLRKADLVTSALLIALGAFVLWRAWLMPWTTSFGMASNWYLSPGLFPAILGVLLIVFSLSVMRNALSVRAHRGIGAVLAATLGGLPRNRMVVRSVIVLALIGAYVLVGLGRFNYFVVSTMFCLSMMLVFHRPDGRFPGLKSLTVIVAVSVLGPLFVGYVFSNFFQVPLP